MADQGIRFFRSGTEFRAWLAKNHARAGELVVGYHKRHTGRPCMTWPESVAEALCFGWIDGVRRSLDGDRYSIRFTPRRKGSKWGAINLRMVKELEAAGRMMDAGRAAVAGWKKKAGENAPGYSTRQRSAELDAPRLKQFKKEKGAWEFFANQPPGYRKLLAWWVMSAKKEETRQRRLVRLIAASAAEKRLL